jgi:hypothetical protein
MAIDRAASEKMRSTSHHRPAQLSTCMASLDETNGKAASASSIRHITSSIW